MKEFLKDMKLQVTEGLQLLALDVTVGIVGRLDEDARDAWVETVIGEAQSSGEADKWLLRPLEIWRPDDRRLAYKRIHSAQGVKELDLLDSRL